VRMPMTPERVWRALNGTGTAGGDGQAGVTPMV
jgi:hypothetical protein